MKLNKHVLGIDLLIGKEKMEESRDGLCMFE